VFRIVERMDAGPVLTARSTDIQPAETAGELHDRLAVSGLDAVKDALAMMADDRRPSGTPQRDELATKAPKLRKSDGAIDFRRDAEDVVNHIHAMTPWPGATVRYESTTGRWENVAIVRARLVDHRPGPGAPPGTIDDRLSVAARGGWIELIEIKPSSGRLMTWREYVNGRHVAAGDRFVAMPPA
jgi:methionyl-tRNA formyltransferase